MHFNPYRLIRSFARRLVDLSVYEYEFISLNGQLYRILERCEPLMTDFNPRDGSCVLQEVFGIRQSLEFTERNFPTIFNMAKITAYLNKLEKFIVNLPDDRPFLKEVIFRRYLQYIEGQLILRYLNRIISAEQLSTFITSYGEEDSFVQHGQAYMHNLDFVQCVVLLCAETHLQIRKFLYTFYQKMIHETFGFGSDLLVKKGWFPGESLGVNASELRVPIQFKSYLYKSGLKSDEENYPGPVGREEDKYYHIIRV